MDFAKTRVFILTCTIMLISLALISLPSIKYASSLGNVSYFNVSLTLNNVPPVVTYVAPITDSPSEGTTHLVMFTFNASDNNGVGDIPASNANVNINNSGTVRSSGYTCIVTGTSGTTNRYECNVSVNYFDPAGKWTINASVYDGSASRAENLTQNLTLGTIYAISLKTNSLTFSGSPGQSGVNASNNPQIVNNTGNAAFNQINLTAYNLASGSNYVGAGNFTVNTSDNAVGQALANNTAVTVLASNLSILSTRGLYVYLNIPSAVANGTYTSVNSWVVTMS